ncbi:hypothetical protein VP01_530g2 [Puccinia sorghi]|uniref:Uncharacterized protein n=1 Tax=Puccinia sorghi TaxID=27349 RepID=A0A0L6UK80_9BASI|nr:hypothetical protein VP01_530g2 [Puccinia sorghi]
MGDKFEVASDSGEGWVMSDEGDCLIEMSLWDRTRSSGYIRVLSAFVTATLFYTSTLRGELLLSARGLNAFTFAANAAVFRSSCVECHIRKLGQCPETRMCFPDRSYFRQITLTLSPLDYYSARTQPGGVIPAYCILLHCIRNRGPRYRHAGAKLFSLDITIQWSLLKLIAHSLPVSFECHVGHSPKACFIRVVWSSGRTQQGDSGRGSASRMEDISCPGASEGTFNSKRKKGKECYHRLFLFHVSIIDVKCGPFWRPAPRVTRTIDMKADRPISYHGKRVQDLCLETETAQEMLARFSSRHSVGKGDTPSEKDMALCCSSRQGTFTAHLQPWRRQPKRAHPRRHFFFFPFRPRFGCPSYGALWDEAGCAQWITGTGSFSQCKWVPSTRGGLKIIQLCKYDQTLKVWKRLLLAHLHTAGQHILQEPMKCPPTELRIEAGMEESAEAGFPLHGLDPPVIAGYSRFGVCTLHNTLQTPHREKRINKPRVWAQIQAPLGTVPWSLELCPRGLISQPRKAASVPGLLK